MRGGKVIILIVRKLNGFTGFGLVFSDLLFPKQSNFDH